MVSERKALERKWAEEFVQGIKNDPHPSIIFKDDIRPITDMKDMIVTSCAEFADNTAYLVKDKRGGEYREIKYRQVIEDINGLGTALMAGGLKGKKVAVIGENSYMWEMAYLATICGIGIIVPLDKELAANELKQLVVAADVSCVFFDKKFEDTFKEMKASGDTCIEVLVNMNADTSNEEVLSWKELVEAGKNMVVSGDRAFIDAEVNNEEMSILLFTSGTTGISKGVMLSHKNIAADIMTAPSVFGVHPTDRFFSFLPVHHTYACTCDFMIPLYKGASIAFCEGLKYIVKNLSEAKPTLFLGVPAVFESLYRKIWANVRKQGKEDLLKKVIKVNKVTKKVGIDLGNIFFKQIRALFGGNLRVVICGGAAINPEILQGFQDFGVTALQGYGLTEAAPLGALNPISKIKNASIGRKFPNFDLKIDNPGEDGNGEICLKGENIMMGYYGRQDLTDEVIIDGWFHTGDLGYIDDEGYAYITGRKKNVIITKNGKNVYPEELEYYLSNIPMVLESMVWERETESGEDTTIVASIRIDEEYLKENYPDKEFTDEELVAMLWEDVDKINEENPFFKRIKDIVLRKTEFEKNSSKKIKRFAEGNKQ